MVKKIYFIENSIQFNSLDLNTTKIAGSEKTLINISNELGKNNQFKIKVFNNTPVENKIDNVEEYPILIMVFERLQLEII